MLTTALVAAVVVGIVGSLILWSNPGRVVNRAVFFSCLCITAWLGTLHLATIAPSGSVDLYRWACAIGATIPLGFWTVRQSIMWGTAGFHPRAILPHLASFAVVACLMAIPFTDYFIPSHSTAQQRIRGWGYYLYLWTLLGVYSYLFYGALRASNKLSGIRRMELQIWLGGGSALILSILLTMTLNTLTHDRVYILIQPVLVLLFYTGIAFAITTRRIFNARQLLLLSAEKAVLVGIVALAGFGLDNIFEGFLPPFLAFLSTIALVLGLAGLLKGWLDRMFRFYPQAGAARHAAFEVARRQARVDQLENAFLEVVRGWGQSETAFIATGSKDQMRGQGLVIDLDSPEMTGLRELRWVTPERLAREKMDENRQRLAALLEKFSIGILVLSEGTALKVAVGVGPAASRLPFTYPQAVQLIELASIIEAALERAHFSAKVQHTEQLATVGLLGASLAHEIRNPLVSIKTFVQLLPTHHHDAAFREKFFKLIGEEVKRIDLLTEQLLDLASPRAYCAGEIELHPLLQSSLDLVASKAAHKNVELLTEFNATPDRAFTDASAAKQVILNLCFNAIQAVEEGPRPSRWVKVATRNTSTGIEMSVSDNGPGIAPEIRPHLFQPFQTTKSSGFGLGLAICSDILANLNATISVDPQLPDTGATFRVIFPCRPLSS